ncbi:MAG TPA: MmcQ/YjbR family DNA-binding protein [Vicinamibacteria bacterium]|nr:MmcQ/YjbR family DNA-binding protein [Vicinamibacteria bacterium]
MVTESQIRRIALSLPGAYERASYEGRPSWRTNPRMFTWIRDEPEALVVWVESLDEKELLIAAEPHVFFTTPHYDGYPIVLVRLGAIDVKRAKELIGESWRLRAPKSLVKNAATKTKRKRLTTKRVSVENFLS